MNWGKYVLEAVTLIVAAVVCALVANAVASRERKLVLVSEYSAPVRPAIPAAAPSAPPAASAGPATTTAPPQKTTATPPPVKPTTDNRQPTTLPRQPATGNRQPVDNRQPIDRFPPHPDKAYVEISYPDVAWLHSKGVLFLDARRTSVYEDGHIAGARSFPVWESDIDQRVNGLFAERSDPAQQNLPIVVYCSGGDCEDSHMLAQKLWGIQFNNVYVYKDGFPDWQAHGGAVDRGTNP